MLNPKNPFIYTLQPKDAMNMYIEYLKKEYREGYYCYVIPNELFTMLYKRYISNFEMGDYRSFYFKMKELSTLHSGIITAVYIHKDIIGSETNPLYELSTWNQGVIIKRTS